MRIPKPTAFVRASVRQTDHGWEELKRNLRDLQHGRSYVKIGVFGGAGGGVQKPGEPPDVVTLARIHEFGAPRANIPQRSFIRAPFDNNRAKYIQIFKVLLRQVYEGKREMADALKIVGLQAVADVNAYVRQGSNLAPLHPYTVRRKMKKTPWPKPGEPEGPVRAPRPLIDTGRMLGAVTYEVVVKGRPGGPAKKGGR